MAASVDVNSNDELNSILKTLAGRDKEAEIYKKYNEFFTSSLLPQLSSKSNKSEVDGDHDVKIWAYGSAAEGLQSFDHCDAGDMDFMIFSNSDNLIIHEDMLEYLFENPLHVRIKGGDHPVLQSCLVEDTEYVSNSALKNFHPAIFGSRKPWLVDVLSDLCQMEDQRRFPFPFNAAIPLFNLKNNPASPAVSLGMSSLMDSASIFTAELANIFVKEAVDDVGSILHFVNGANGIDHEYTGEYAEILKDWALLLADYAHSPMFGSLTPILFASGPACQNSLDKIFARFEALESRSSKETMHNNDQQVVTPEKRDRKGSQGNVTNFSEAVGYFLFGLERGARLLARLDEVREFERRFHQLDERMSRTSTEEMETKFEITELVKNGIDFIPAIRSRGWPTVAREWIKRERQWPSPDIVDKVIQEGFHLVVKPPKNNSKPECDFRISFSHAEYLLSQEMNDIQRECYRCLKRYHRAHLSTQPKSLVSFHLKNIFLQTIEETGAEMWTESNRAECMMKLLGNLLKALRKKDLRHFFVRSYNLFGEDYIENVEVLHSLAEKAEEIMGNPVRFAKQLILKQEDTKECEEEKDTAKENFPNFPNFPFGKPVPHEQQKKTERISPEGNYVAQWKKGSATVSVLPKKETQGSDPPEHRFHGLVPSGIWTQFAQSAFSNLFGTESTQLNMRGDFPLD
ncbi:hypothetical protein ACROYT_G033893 [Oculina patagonica]